jgi:hypothetical protein
MSASRANSTGRRRARSIGDESPIIISGVAILAVIAFSCVGMIAPVLWDALVGSPEPRWGEQSCTQGTEAAGARKRPDKVRLQAFRPRPTVQFDPLIPHL